MNEPLGGELCGQATGVENPSRTVMQERSIAAVQTVPLKLHSSASGVPDCNKR